MKQYNQFSSILDHHYHRFENKYDRDFCNENLLIWTRIPVELFGIRAIRDLIYDEKIYEKT